MRIILGIAGMLALFLSIAAFVMSARGGGLAEIEAALFLLVWAVCWGTAGIIEQIQRTEKNFLNNTNKNQT